MSKTAVVTSFSLKGWHEYGSRFVDTFDKFWPVGVDLHLVSEDDFEIERNGSERKVRFWSLQQYSRLANGFLEVHSDNKWAHGDPSVPRPFAGARWAPRVYSFRHDAYKFSKKVFAIELVARKAKVDRLLWVDADTLTHAPIPLEFPQVVLPEQFALSYLARVGYHSECGFVGYNLKHEAAGEFIKAFAMLYASGEVFTLEEWHDSWVFDWLRVKLKTPAWPIPHCSNQHPFINSQLGQYMDHLKGARKARGRSHIAEQRKHSNVPYWSR